MPTITMCAGRANQVPSLLSGAKKSVGDYVAGLKSLEARLLAIGGACSVDDVIRSIRSSTQTQEAKAEALDALEECVSDFAADVVCIDGKVAFVISTWPYSGMALLLAGLVISCRGSVSNRSLPPPYEYDESSPQSMAGCLGIRYQDYIRTMEYQYGLDERIARLYMELYLQAANDLDMRGRTEREVACGFNRVIASLCMAYSGEKLTFRLTAGNYRSVEAHKMLMDRYGFSEADAIDFTIALNVQHGFACEEVEAYFGFSRENGILFRRDSFTTPVGAGGREWEADGRIVKDLVHEAVQYVEFNNGLDFVDAVSGSTDRMISYSGDIISTSYNDVDFMSDIDPNNIQKRLEEGKGNFLKVQQEYNEAVMNGTINPKAEFTSNNGGIDEIRNKINHDIKSTLGAYLGRKVIGEIGEKEKRAGAYKRHMDEFIGFLQGQSSGGLADDGT